MGGSKRAGTGPSAGSTSSQVSRARRAGETRARSGKSCSSARCAAIRGTASRPRAASGRSMSFVASGEVALPWRRSIRRRIAIPRANSRARCGFLRPVQAGRAFTSPPGGAKLPRTKHGRKHVPFDYRRGRLGYRSGLRHRPGRGGRSRQGRREAGPERAANRAAGGDRRHDPRRRRHRARPAGGHARRGAGAGGGEAHRGGVRPLRHPRQQRRRQRQEPQLERGRSGGLRHRRRGRPLRPVLRLRRRAADDAGAKGRAHHPHLVLGRALRVAAHRARLLARRSTGSWRSARA